VLSAEVLSAFSSGHRVSLTVLTYLVLVVSSNLGVSCGG